TADGLFAQLGPFGNFGDPRAGEIYMAKQVEMTSPGSAAIRCLGVHGRERPANRSGPSARGDRCCRAANGCCGSGLSPRIAFSSVNRRMFFGASAMALSGSLIVQAWDILQHDGWPSTRWLPIQFL
ncbi:MAG: hypothetical protein WDO24_29635, partial [Pseudomonadota bacterium]